MRPAARYIAAGIVTAALGAAPGLAEAQTTDQAAGTAATASDTQAPASPASSPQASSASSSSTATTSGVDEAAAREHLSQARQALAELTKLPAAAELQGDQRAAVANLIQAFNGLATATSDWRSKFSTVSDQLDAILDSGEAGATGTAGAETTPGASTTGGTETAGATGASGTGGGYDPTILAKLREVRMHLDGFQEASGDPTPHFDAIEEIVDAALNGNAPGTSVGTSGSSGGSVTIGRDQLEEIRQHVEKLRAAAEAAANR